MGRPKIEIPRSVLEQLYGVEELSPKEIAARFGCQRQTIINHLRYYDLLVRTRGEGTALAKISHPRTNFSGDLVEKAYLIGLRTGDLTVDMANEGGRTIRVSCASTKSAQIELIKGLFEGYGGVLLNGPYANGRVFIQCLLNLSFDFLLPKLETIPDWVLNSEGIFLSFLAGYSDAEAYIGISGGKASFRLATAEEKILDQIYARFAHFDIHCQPPRLWLKSGYKNKKTGVVTRKNIWRLGVYHRQSLYLLLEALLPYLKHTKRKQDADRVLAFLRDKRVDG